MVERLQEYAVVGFKDTTYTVELRKSTVGNVYEKKHCGRGGSRETYVRNENHLSKIGTSLSLL